MIIDCIMLRDELDMLECRLRELDGLADRHVVVESAQTHRGDPKPLWYADNRERFAPWADKISHVVADLPDSADPWVREHAQRNAALPAIADAADNDIVLISDVDEFPPPEWRQSGPAVSFSQRLCMYAVDWEYPERHLCTVAARVSFARHLGLATARDARGSWPVIPGGSHLTWLGGPEGQRQKLAVTCHTEMTALSRELLASGRCYTEGIHHTGDFPMIPVDVDETWPRWIYERKCPDNWFRPR